MLWTVHNWKDHRRSEKLASFNGLVASDNNWTIYKNTMMVAELLLLSLIFTFIYIAVIISPCPETSAIARARVHTHAKSCAIACIK